MPPLFSRRIRPAGRLRRTTGDGRADDVTGEVVSAESHSLRLSPRHSLPSASVPFPPFIVAPQGPAFGRMNGEGNGGGRDDIIINILFLSYLFLLWMLIII